ncbi:uncharacterized protein LOC129595081 [Paramacrobiotus metropolitanus]|uniref:uncharacterized protein LOC129595081 n=1 Tax=Paramacrobiotus metropolitanus TaxID=2943436 RepID=UPI0024460A2B|nr:uncharacterized protein LOC129595081 [Paramacrobiotus metropolitanus]
MRQTATWFILILMDQCAGFTDHDYETECNAPTLPPTVHTDTVPPISSFRMDTLTAEECRTYAEMSCGDGKYDYCIMDYPPDSQVNPLTKTYFEISCWDGGTRTAIAQYSRNVSVTSPNRAIALELAERNDTEDPVHHEAIDPIRKQIIQLYMRSCVTAQITAKIFGAGDMPNLVTLQLWRGRDLVVKKRDFSRLPNIRMIIFGYTTIQEMEAYTFTDIVHLESLALEKKIGYNLYLLQPEESKWLSSMRPWSLQASDMAKVGRLHCDCAFAWYRNFLKRKPYLIQGDREKWRSSEII